MRRGFWWLALGVVFADQLTKQIVARWLPEHHPPVPVVPGLIYFTHVRNPGTAFGLLKEGGAILILVAAVAIFVILGYWARLQRQNHPVHPLLLAGLALPLGGAAGNLLDRLATGKVIDFIDLRFWPVFNLADTAITMGALAAGYYFFFLHDRLPAADTPAGLNPVTGGQEETGAAPEASD